MLGSKGLSLLIILITGIGYSGVPSYLSEAHSETTGETLRIILPFERLDRGVRPVECELVHELVDALALACPAPLAKDLVRRGMALEDRLYRVFDLESDFYIKAVETWALGLKGAGVKVAVLDTGVDATHSELADSILLAANFVRGPNDPRDQHGHGTHVIGIVTANGIRQVTGGGSFLLADPNRATGAAPDAFILSGRVCGTSRCFTADIEKGIEWAVQQGAKVINLSLGGGNFGSHCDNDRLAAKANWAVGQGVVVVAASGNDASGVSSPACGSKVIAVGVVYQRNIGPQDYSPTCVDETTAQDQIVCFSNRGPALDLVAPGAGILSSFSCLAAGDCTREWYAWAWGTSQASPQVAAVAALVLSVNASLTPSEVKNILESTARDLGQPGRDDVYGRGLVDAFAAIRAAGASARDLKLAGLAPEKTVTYNTIKANPININATLQNLGTQTESFTVKLFTNGTLLSSSNVTSLAPGSSLTISFRWNTTLSVKGTYRLSATIDPLPGETNTTNNGLVDGEVQVRFPGDITGDGRVDIIDASHLAIAFDSKPGGQNWDSRADLDNDKDVDITDASILAFYFGTVDF